MTFDEKIQTLKDAILNADAIIIGAGAGLSAAAGFTYSGERFEKYFSDFRKKYGFSDMYSGGFYPYKRLEEFWAFWSRNVFVNRYLNPPKKVYEDLYSIVSQKDYFVLTTNVDHCFQKALFSKNRLFYTQGDYGLFQCSEPCHQKTYDNEEQILKMLRAQGIDVDLKDDLKIENAKMTIPTGMNLRCDDTFVEDDGWHAAAERYGDFLETRKARKNGKVLFLELGVGANTPGIIKYPFWQMTAQNKNAIYACLNAGEAAAPQEIEAKSILINADIAVILEKLKDF